MSGGVLNCRLPVAGFNAGSGPDGLADQKGTGGFVDFPSGNYTPAGDSDRTYLASAKMWLPIHIVAVSPDQRSYVQARVSAGLQPTYDFYIVQVKTRAERLLYRAPAGRVAYALAFAAEGVYVETMPPGGPSTATLILIDAGTGAIRNVLGSVVPAGVINQWWWAISGGAAWSMEQRGPVSALTYRLVRLDLTDGSVTDWYDGADYFFIGFDSGHDPILGAFGAMVGDSNVRLFGLAGPKQTVTIEPRGGPYKPGGGSAITDSHGTWFGSYDGAIWLYSSTIGLKKVAMVPPQPGATGQPYDQHAWRSVAGPCV